MLFESSVAPSVAMSRMSRFSRMSTTKSRQSSFYTNDGDIQMDNFNRQFKRVEASVTANEELKLAKQKDHDANIEEYLKEKQQIDARNTAVIERYKALKKRLDIANTCKLTIKEAESLHMSAETGKMEAELYVADLKDALTSEYNRIQSVIDEMETEIPAESEDYAPLLARTEALKKDISNRNSIIMQKNEEMRKQSVLLEELETKEKRLLMEKDLSEKMDAELTKRYENAVTALTEVCEDLTPLQRIVSKIEADTKSMEALYRTISPAEKFPDFRRDFAEMDRIDGNNAKRRRLYENRHAMLQSRMNDLREIMQRRAHLGRRRSVAAHMMHMLPSEIEAVVNKRLDDITEHHKSIMTDINNLDECEVTNREVLERMEQEWNEKMERIEELRALVAELEQVKADVSQKIASIEHLCENRRILTSKVDVMKRRIGTAENRQKTSTDRDPGVTFGRDRIEQKERRADDRQSVIDERKERLAEGIKEADAREAESEELTRVVRGLEADVHDFEKKLMQSADEMRIEKEALDRLLESIPMDDNNL